MLRKASQLSEEVKEATKRTKEPNELTERTRRRLDGRYSTPDLSSNSCSHARQSLLKLWSFLLRRPLPPFAAMTRDDGNWLTVDCSSHQSQTNPRPCLSLILSPSSPFPSFHPCLVLSFSLVAGKRQSTHMEQGNLQIEWPHA